MIVGILGGVGSGKSTVTAVLRELGARCVDADSVAHEVLELAETRAELRAWLGEEVFDSDGKVDRDAIGRRVFGNPRDLKRLEELIHPEVRRRIEQEVNTFKDMVGAESLMVLDVPLLASSPLRSLCDRLVYVDSTFEQRVERTASRGWTAADLRRREAAQLSCDEKKRMAHDVIDNTGSPAATRRQVVDLHDRLRRRTTGHPEAEARG